MSSYHVEGPNDGREEWEELFALHTDTLTEIINRVIDLEDTVSALSNGAGAREQKTLAAYCWREITDPQVRAQLWRTIREWVDWVSTRYLSHGAIRIPPCWYRHPVAVEELTALWAGWYMAYHQEEPNTLASDWHQRYLWPTLERLKEYIYPACLREGVHQEPRIRPILTDVGFEAFVSDDAA